MVSLLLAASPFGLAFFLLLCRWQTRTVGLFVFGYLLLLLSIDPHVTLPASKAGMALITGTTTAFTILIIIFPALFLYHLQRTCGTLHLLVDQLSAFLPDQQLQVLFLVLCLCPLFEALCGFGISILLVAPILLLLNVQPIRVLLLCLLGQATVAWGAMGVAITVGAQITAFSVSALGSMISILSAPLLFLVGVATLVVIGMDAVKRWWWLVGCNTIVFTAVTWVCSRWLSVEVAGMLAALAGGIFFYGVAVLLQKKAHRWEPRQQQRVPATTKALFPYASLLILLLLSHVFPLAPWLQHHLVFSVAAWHWSFALLYTPGFWIFLVIGLSLLVLKPTWEQFRQAVHSTTQQFSPVAITILSFLWVAQVMDANGMTALLGSASAQLGTNYRWLSPLLAAMSGWLTGSVVGGNSALALLQTAMARHMDLSQLAILATQTVGAAVGRMLTPSCLILISSATQVPNAENLLLRKGGVLVGILLLALTLWLDIVLGFSWMTMGLGIFMTLLLAVLLTMILDASLPTAVAAASPLPLMGNLSLSDMANMPTMVEKKVQ